LEYIAQFVTTALKSIPNLVPFLGSGINFLRVIQKYTNFGNFTGQIFRVLQRFTIRLCSLTNFTMLTKARFPLAKISATEKFNSLFFGAICGRSDKG
jgi:hypothetical protein